MQRAAVAVLLGVAAAACASRGDVETMGDALRDEMAILAEGQRQLVEAIRADLETIESSSERRETTGRGELERLVGQLERAIQQQNDHAVQNNQLLNDIYEILSRSGPPSSMGPTGSSDTGPPAPGAVDPEDGTAVTSGSEDAFQVYRLALDMYERENFETARDTFRRFLAQYGDDVYAPDAQYWLAMTYEKTEDPGNALEEYRRLTELYPDSNRAPAALLRRGTIEAMRGNTAVARRLFTQIESGYPNSPEAPQATEELRKLGG